MSLARVYTTKKVRKDWTCGKCKSPIVKGQDGRRSFAVGFRGYEQTRCMKSECTPTRAELESSAVASVYAAIDDIDWAHIDGLTGVEEALQDVASACQEVADEYDSNEMIEVNYDLQERRDTLQAAADELENWSPDEDEPLEGDFDTSEEYDDAFSSWIETVVDSARDAVESLELP